MSKKEEPEECYAMSPEHTRLITSGIRRANGVTFMDTGIIPLKHRRMPADACIVFIRPVMPIINEDFTAFRSWYISVYDMFLDIEKRFGLYFDLRKATMPPLTSIAKLFNLTQQLMRRTRHQVVGSVILMHTVRNVATGQQRIRQAFLNCVQSLVNKGDQNAPRKMITDKKEASSFLVPLFTIREDATTLHVTSAVRKDVQRVRKAME